MPPFPFIPKIFKYQQCRADSTGRPARFKWLHWAFITKTAIWPPEAN